jgi:hypothetical protein
MGHLDEVAVSRSRGVEGGKGGRRRGEGGRGGRGQEKGREPRKKINTVPLE